MRKALFVSAIGVLLALPAAAQREDFLDVMVVKVKPEKAAEFRAISKRIADANRRHGGDHWLAVSTVYGDGETHAFISPRKDFAAVDTAYGQFMKAMAEAVGPSGVEKLFDDFVACLQSSHSEIRRRRWDLSANAPEGEAATKMLGNARWLGTTRVQIRPGHAADFEANLKRLKQALERTPGRNMLVSQTVYGGPLGTYYVSRLLDSFAGFDATPQLRELLGEDEYRKYSEGLRDTVVNADSAIMRIVPEWSSMMKEAAAVAPDFWNPKPKPPAAAKKKQ